MIQDVHDIIVAISAEFESWGCDILAQTLAEDKTGVPEFVFEYRDYHFRAYLEGQTLVVETKGREINWGGRSKVSFDLSNPDVFDVIRDWLTGCWVKSHA